jgi:DNA-binding transcriptional ArsR family regulator
MANPSKSLVDRLNVNQCCRFLGALAEPERLRIVQSLMGGPKSVGEVCKAVGSPVANTSHHLRQLSAAGLVTGTKRGRFVMYALVPEVFRQAEEAAAKGDGSAVAAAGRDVLDFGCCQLDLGKPAASATRRGGRGRKGKASA